VDSRVYVVPKSKIRRTWSYSPAHLYAKVFITSRSQWPRGLRRRSAAARLLGLWVRIPPGAWMYLSCECCVLSGRGLCDGLITHPVESYRLWCVVVCDLETSRMRRPWPTVGCCSPPKKHYNVDLPRGLRRGSAAAC